MSADILREAAALMRSRAEAATTAPWISRQEHGRDYTDEGWSYVAVTSVSAISAPDVAATAYPGDGESDLAIEDAEHIASWHPAVALAVADWLDREERAWEQAHDEHWLNSARGWDKNNNAPMGDEAHSHFLMTAAEFADGQHRPALTVARAYLGASS